MEWAQVKNKKKLEKTHLHREIFGWTCLQKSTLFYVGPCGDTCDGEAPLVSRFTREMEGEGGSGAVDVLVLEEGLIREVTVPLISLG